MEVRTLEHDDSLVEPRTYAPRSVRQRRAASALFAADIVALLAATGSASLASWSLDSAAMETVGPGLGSPAAVASLALIVITIALMHWRRLYSLESIGWGSGEHARITQSVIVGLMSTLLALLLLGLQSPSREWVVLAGVLSLILIATGRALLRFAGSRQLQQGGWLQRPTLIVGTNVEAAEVVRLLQARTGSGLSAVGCLRSSLKDTLSFDYCAPVIPTLGTARDLVSIVTTYGIDTVIIVASAFDYEVMQRMIKELRDLPVSVHISSALSEVLSSRVLMQEIGGLPLISLRGISMSAAKLRRKRAFDLLIAGLIVILGMPLWAVIALLIKATSEGPVLYRQERIGRGGTPFFMYKFRSMVADAESLLAELQNANGDDDAPLYQRVSDYGCKIQNDPRITWIGRWMRKLSLDEFPQLINVLRGEMSLVGPRPPLPFETAKYSEQDWRRLEVPPGMTGLWQVSGRAELTFRDMVRLDVFYIDNWSMGLDTSLLMRTVPAVVRARGAC